jgi:hypothetical protein
MSVDWRQDEQGWYWEDASGARHYRAASPSYRAWRGAVAPPAPQPPATTTTSPSYAAWNRAVPSASVAAPPGFGGRSAARLFGTTQPATPTTLPAAPAPATAPPPRMRRSPAELQARFAALVRSGLVNPSDITDTTGRVRPEVMAQLDAIGPYRGPDVSAGEAGAFGDVTGEIVNPEEIRYEQWQKDFLARQEAANVLRSGYYTDPATGMVRVTAARGEQLLDRFGNARAAEERYRQRLAQGNVAEMGSQQRIADLERQRGEVAARQPYGRATVGAEQQIADINRQIQEATMAYNRARGATQAVAQAQPITQNVLARGLTDEQFNQLAQAAREGYTDEEWERLMRTPGNIRGAQYLPAYDYRRAAAARGVLF